MSEFKFRNRSLNYQKNTLIIGILNVTPDSFSDGGRYLDTAAAVQRAEQLLEAGADIIDIGGESTRPGSQPISVAAEIERIAPVIKKLRQNFPTAVLSVDTWKSEVAAEMLKLGVDIINDVYGLQGDLDMAKVIAEYKAGVIIMNNPTFYLPERAESKVFPHRDNLAKLNCQLQKEIEQIYKRDIGVNACIQSARYFFKHSLSLASAAGITDDHIMLDPGLGFGLTESENITLIRHLAELKSLDERSFAMLSAPSRKRFIRSLLSTEIPEGHSITEAELDAATGTICLLSVENGADAVRVHSVETIAPMLKLHNQLVPYHPQRCYLSLGSNLGDRESYLTRAVELLRDISGVCNLQTASLYETAPWGKTDQQHFLNTAVAFDYSYDAYRLIADCQKIEQRLGRERHEKWGPRTIDIDIIFFGNRRHSDRHLTLPHPYYQERDFVLIPLLELQTGERRCSEEVKLYKPSEEWQRAN